MITLTYQLLSSLEQDEYKFLRENYSNKKFMGWNAKADDKRINFWSTVFTAGLHIPFKFGKSTYYGIKSAFGSGNSSIVYQFSKKEDEMKEYIKELKAVGIRERYLHFFQSLCGKYGTNKIDYDSFPGKCPYKIDFENIDYLNPRRFEKLYYWE